MKKYEKVTYNEYLKKFKDLYYNKINEKERFKVDIPINEKTNKYYIGVNSCICLNFNEKEKIITIKGLIAFKDGSNILKYVINKYKDIYLIILDSFSSNDYFYKKNNFKIYKKDAYNSKYDPKKLNKNKESVYYYYYNDNTLKYLSLFDKI